MPTPSPSAAELASGAVTWVDGSTLVVAGLTLVATVAFAIVDIVLRSKLSGRVDFHTRWTHALTNAFSKKAAQQVVGVQELSALTRSKWASREDRELALRAMEELDQD